MLETARLLLVPVSFFLTAVLPVAAAEGGAARRSVLLLDLAGLSFDQAAELERAASGAVVFTQAISQGAAAAPSAASLLTSQYVQTHGLAAPGDHISTAAVTLAEVLGRAGYATGAFVADEALSAPAGFARGFMTTEFEADSSSAAFRRAWDAATLWLQAQRSPFFLYLHGASLGRDVLSGFLALRKSCPAGSVLVVTAGVGPGERPDLEERVVHVPLLIWHPDLKRRRVAAIVRLVDLGPALLEWANTEAPAQFQGVSLALLAEGKSAGARYGFSATVGASGRLALFSIRRPGWHMIYDKAMGESRLYDLKADPDMTEDVQDRHPDVAADLAQKLMSHLRETRAADDRRDRIAPEMLRQLREKGYW